MFHGDHDIHLQQEDHCLRPMRQSSKSTVEDQESCGSRARHWCFTLNNYTEDDVAYLEAFSQTGPVVYIVFGKEVGESGTPHLQGYIIFRSQQYFSYVKALLPRGHWGVKRDTSKKASDYCKKDGDFFEAGQLPKESGEMEKDRWELARKRAREGDLDEIPPDIFIKYYRTLTQIKKDYMTKPADLKDVTGVWLYGPPGIGKSHSARQRYPNSYIKGQNKWWDGYQGEETVIIDDFDCKELGHHLKIWSDQYAFIAENKGALMIRAKVICITSNYHPRQMGWDEVTTEAIMRRFKIEAVEDYRAVEKLPVEMSRLDLDADDEP